MENQNKITDEQLKQELLRSYIDDAQKEELTPMISSMNSEERDELMKLIQSSQQEFESAQAEGVDQEALAKLNADYNKKIDELGKESVEEAYAEAEKLESDEKESVLEEVEGEIGTMNIEPSKNTTEGISADRTELVKQSHTKRNLILIFVVLILFGVALFTALKYL